MLNLLVSTITILSVCATVVFSVWTIVDTRRKYSHQDFVERRTTKKEEAEKRFKNKTRLGK